MNLQMDYIKLCNELQQATKNHNHPQGATRSHNDPQLRHKMNKTHKELHNLVNALSPLNSLSARILMKIVLMPVPQVRSVRNGLLAPGTHTLLKHYSDCGGSISKHNIMDLIVKG